MLLKHHHANDIHGMLILIFATIFLLKVDDFLFSLEAHAELTSHISDDNCIDEHAHYHMLIEENKKLKVRNLCRKAFNEGSYFSAANDAIIVSSKDNRKNGCAEEEVKNHIILICWHQKTNP